MGQHNFCNNHDFFFLEFCKNVNLGRVIFMVEQVMVTLDIINVEL